MIKRTEKEIIKRMQEKGFKKTVWDKTKIESARAFKIIVINNINAREASGQYKLYDHALKCRKFFDLTLELLDGIDKDTTEYVLQCNRNPHITEIRKLVEERIEFWYRVLVLFIPME